MPDPDLPVSPDDTIVATVGLSLGGTPFKAQVEVPAGPAGAEAVLPFARQLTDAVVGVVVAETERGGRCISCKLGCAACCRQLVPVSPAEARRFAEMVEEFPEPRRSEVLERFATARRRLATAVLLDTLADDPPGRGRELKSMLLDYSALELACPFLEDEKCSIYAERPLRCREYMVTSPPEYCSRPGEGLIEGVRPPVLVSAAFRRLAGQEVEGSDGWIPLVLAPEWAATHPAPAPTRTGPEVMAQFFELVTGAPVEVPDSVRPGPSEST